MQGLHSAPVLVRQQAEIVASSDTKKRRQLPALTTIRFVATAFVLLRHGAEVFGFDHKYMIDQVGYWQGLTCFFVLSGFILTYVHPTIDDTKAALHFWGARFARIWPSYTLALLLFVALNPATLAVKHGALLFAANLFLVQAWTFYRPAFFGFNTPTWSLSVEMFFYVIFPHLVKSLKTTWKWKLAGSLGVALLMVLLCIGDIFPDYSPFHNSAPALININSFSRLFEFVCGMVAANFFMRTDNLVFSRVKATWFECGAFLLALMALLLPVAWTSPVAVPILEPLRCWIIYAGIAPAYALLVYILARQEGAISQFLSNKTLVYLGELSFSLFLFHFPMFLVFLKFQPLWISGSPYIPFAMWWFLSLIVAALNYKFFETPCRKWLLKRMHAW